MNEVNMIENLKLAAEARKAAYAAAKAAVAEKFTAIINEAAAASGVAGYKMEDRGYGVDFEYIHLKSESRNEIDLYYHEDRYSDEDSPRQLQLNVCAMGSIGANDKDAVAYYTLVGYLANRLGELTEKLNAIEGWGALKEARRALWSVNDEIERLEREMKEKAEAERKAALEARLVVGAELAVGLKSEYINGQGYKTTGFEIMKVEKMTAKLVWFEGNWHQYKKAEVVENLARGFNIDRRSAAGWSFAADVNFADFADAK